VRLETGKVYRITVQTDGAMIEMEQAKAVGTEIAPNGSPAVLFSPEPGTFVSVWVDSGDRIKARASRAQRKGRARNRSRAVSDAPLPQPTRPDPGELSV
jgi:hypothetical protein